MVRCPQALFVTEEHSSRLFSLHRERRRCLDGVLHQAARLQAGDAPGAAVRGDLPRRHAPVTDAASGGRAWPAARPRRPGAGSGLRGKTAARDRLCRGAPSWNPRRSARSAAPSPPGPARGARTARCAGRASPFRSSSAQEHVIREASAKAERLATALACCHRAARHQIPPCPPSHRADPERASAGSVMQPRRRDIGTLIHFAAAQRVLDSNFCPSRKNPARDVDLACPGSTYR